MLVFNLQDKNFEGDNCSSLFGQAQEVVWDRTCSQEGPIVYTDKYLNDELLSLNVEKIAWLMEPYEVQEDVYNWVKENQSIFKEIWTHDEFLLSLHQSKYCPQAGTWIAKEDRGLWPKNKLVSYIASNLNITKGHWLRNHIRNKLPETVDIYGRGINEIDFKIQGLKDYYFSIAIENCKRDIYFTEKIIDCFLTGTMPIYWGTRKIADIFNPEGILFFDHEDELHSLLNYLGPYCYNEKAVFENYQIALQYQAGEDILFRHRGN